MHKTFCAALVLLSAWPVLSSEVGVRIRFGLTDKEPKKWDATISVSPGKIERIDGWRFQDGDAVQEQTGWKASTRPLTVRRSNNPKKAGKGKGGNANMADNGVILLLTGVDESSRVKCKSEQGDFDFQLSDVSYGKFIEKLDGAVDIERVAASRPLTTARVEDDYPALAVAPDGTTFATWISFTPGLDRDQRAQRLEKEPDLSQLAKEPGGDQLWLRVQKDGTWSEPVAVTQGHGDLYKCSVTVDGKGNAWVFWAENASWPKQSVANFEIKARSWSAGKLSEPVNLSENPGNDVGPVSTTDGNGRVWVAWQGARGNAFHILERHQKADGSWTSERSVSTQKGNCWTPAIVATPKGERLAIAWDTYDKGDYDVWVREFSGENASDARPVANSEKYEARPALAYDRDGRLWISYELSGPTWGKDWGALVRNKGIGLYRDRQIGMRVLENGKWFEPAGSFVSALPGAQRRRGPANLPVNRPEPEVTTRRAGQEAEAAPANTYNNLGRIVSDKDGRIWLFARSREGAFHTPLGSVWIDYAAYYDGKAWVGPIILPHSDNLLYNLPAVVAHPQGGLVVAHSTDHRQDRHVQRGRGGNDSLSAMRDPFDNDVFISRLEMNAQPVAISLKPASQPPVADAQPSAATVKERAEVERCRTWKIDYQGKPLQLIRGEFHRHTEISGDGGNDGPVEDMWRYAIDVAAMDWLGCGDHDNGAGREYPWWLTQKTTDAFRLLGSFDPPFSYERSVSYPEGHRNVVFAQRGIRTLPRLPKTEAEPVVHAPDTQMLYKYLRQFNGVCASHSSATDMGTDWRDNDPLYEPMVEIYQGCRQSYERPGSPRSPTAQDAIGGWRPKGFINLALLKGYKFSFQSSSDHTSTHISYALVYSESRSREDLIKAMRARHTYAATDNIIADWRSGEHMQGDEFTTSQTPAFQLKLLGTAPFSKVTIVKDDVEIKTVTPDKAEVELAWTDPSPASGKSSYYYARGEQSDGELVWASPMWVTYTGK